MIPFFQKIVLVVLSAITIFDFVRTPFTNDVAIFFGVENIADKYYQFPQGIDIAWEAKPIGNRVITYTVLKIAELFTTFENHTDFVLVSKIVIVIVIILIAVYFTYVIKGDYTFWIVLFSFLSCINFCVMQAEYYAVLLAVLSIALILHDNPYTPYLAGLAIFIMASIKGITLFLFIPLVCGAYLLGKPKETMLVKVLGGFWIAGVAAIILQLTAWKNMLPDLLLAPYITGVGRMALPEMVSLFLFENAFALWYIPIVLIGGIGALLLLFSKKLHGMELYLFPTMWISSILMVVIHSEYFAYQFFVYVVAAIVTIIMCMRILDKAVLKSETKQVLIRNTGFCIIFVMFAIFMYLNSFNGAMTETERNFYGQQNNYTGEIESRFNISNQSSVLYLDAGVAPYYFMANSSSRYICPLPLQRTGPDWNIWDKQQVQDAYRDALAYDGTYIVGDGAFGYQDWLHLEYSDRKELRDKLDSKYRVVWNKGWTIYKRI